MKKLCKVCLIGLIMYIIYDVVKITRGFDMLREFIRKLFEVRGNDLSFLNVGDIIWAKRYKTEEGKNKIKKDIQKVPMLTLLKILG